MKKIAIDCRFANTKSGLGRYTQEIVRHISEEEPLESFILLVKSRDEEWIKGLKGNPQIIPVPIPHYSVAEQIRLSGILKKYGASLLFSPHFNVPFFCPIPFVMTIHDLILHWFPNLAPLHRRIAYKILMSRSVRRAKRIIAVSNYVLEELCYCYGKRAGKKTTVVYEGVTEIFTGQDEYHKRDACDKYGLRKPFYLYVGNAKEHKNVQMLIDAFHMVPGNDKELVLISSGEELDRLDKGGRVSVIRDVPDDDLPSIYSAAIAFVTATLYEGFCLPILEAQACGCPVIATKRGAIPEVANRNAILVEPRIEELVSAMKNMPKKQSKIINSFSWKKSAQETLAVLHSVL